MFNERSWATSSKFSPMSDTTLPRWSVSELHESFDSRSFLDEMERARADADRLIALFDECEIRAVARRKPTAQDAAHADRVIAAFNETVERSETLGAYVYATVSTDTRHEHAQSLLS